MITPLQLIRKILGSLILFFNWLFSPKGIEREAEEQSQIDEKTKKLKLYQFHACPFCVKVRRSIKRMSLKIEIRDAQKNEQFREELATQGGKIKVPCLRIEQGENQYTWMYESNDIIAYLKNKL